MSANKGVSSGENVQYILPAHYAETILRMSKNIVELAQQHEWLLARQLEAKRHVVMQELFSHPDIDEALPEIASLLHEVMQLDAEVIINGEIDLQDMVGQINDLGKGKRAVSAYLKT